MAFALLASLPPVNGLYSSFFPLIPYFFMGTAHQMVPGMSGKRRTETLTNCCHSESIWDCGRAWQGCEYRGKALNRTEHPPCGWKCAIYETISESWDGVLTFKVIMSVAKKICERGTQPCATDVLIWNRIPKGFCLLVLPCGEFSHVFYLCS